jgi:hypothetical protein
MPAVVPIITAVGVIAASKIGANAQKASTNAQLQSNRDTLSAQMSMSEKAAAAEKEAADAALKFQTDQRDYDRETARIEREQYLQRMSPYINIGNQAFGRLSSILGQQPPADLMPPPTSMGGANTQGTPAKNTVGGEAQGATPAQVGVETQTTPTSVGGGGGSLTSLYPSSSTQANAAIGAGATQPVSTGAGGVQMRAPTGEIGIVPYAKVAQAIAAGARRIS